ncbi:ninja-family protein AFP3-like [Solanum stenotomum]|uniref:ninja-family protein AFP3-like n=1 Tax=Solanum stenotomum TaxID=172797 RepID=UPI0020D0A83D|nr:ninja-family protein AFP3-like [Solanum stenotomum]
MAEPKGKLSTCTSAQQEMDLNLSPSGSYNCEKTDEISMPQPFSQIRASAANNPAFQRAIEIIRSDLHNKLEDTSKICENEKSAIKFNTGKGKSIVFPESNGEKPLKKVKNSNVVTSMDTSDLLRIMPSVTTSGGIINGKVTEGFLFNYGKGKQTSIVCICHGRFFSPAEFVKHGGGKEVDNPMEFINIADDASIGNA